MKDLTFGTLICCLFLAFMLGFVTCHKIYAGLDNKDFHGFSNIWRHNTSLLSF
jgi:hypothetical protein